MNQSRKVMWRAVLLPEEMGQGHCFRKLHEALVTGFRDSSNVCTFLCGRLYQQGAAGGSVLPLVA